MKTIDIDKLDVDLEEVTDILHACNKYDWSAALPDILFILKMLRNYRNSLKTGSTVSRFHAREELLLAMEADME